MKAIIESIQNRLASISEIKYIDEDWGQLDTYSPHFPVKWPCVLIDIVESSYSDIGRENGAVPINRQEQISILQLRVANLKTTNTSFKAPAVQKAKARSIWNEIEEIHKMLHGWSELPYMGKLMRIGITRATRDDGVQEYMVRYSFGAHGV